MTGETLLVDAGREINTRAASARRTIGIAFAQVRDHVALAVAVAVEFIRPVRERVVAGLSGIAFAGKRGKSWRQRSEVPWRQSDHDHRQHCLQRLPPPAELRQFPSLRSHCSDRAKRLAKLASIVARCPIKW